MFEVTIKGETLEGLAFNLRMLNAQFIDEPFPTQTPPAPKPAAKAKAKAAPQPEPEDEEVNIDGDDEALDLEAEELEPAKPQPKASRQLVDAGTGKPIPEDAAPVKMTFDDVKVAATQLAKQDTPKLREILISYGAGMISEIPKAKLGEFASDVLEALDA